MLRPRIIPCLLLKNGELVKTIKFEEEKYIGDPINAVKIFNEKEVDELVILDISATTNNEKPNFKLISHIAAECRMPLCYGGGIKTVDEIEKLIRLGVEKIALSSSAIYDFELIKKATKKVGSQSIVVVLDVKQTGLIKKEYKVFTHRGKKPVKKNLYELIYELQISGIGEIIINSIDNDGTRKGYNFDLIDKVFNLINVPLTVLGGAGSINHVIEVIKRYGIIGVAAGSIFVLKGKFRAVLIQYFNKKEKDQLVNIE